MTSDNGNSRDEKLVRAAVAIDRLAAGETPEQIRSSPRPEYDPTPAEKEAIAEFLEFPGSLPQYIKFRTCRTCCGLNILGKRSRWL